MNHRIKSIVLFVCGLPIGFIIGQGLHLNLCTPRPEPPLWYAEGVWHVDGSPEMMKRAHQAANAGESILVGPVNLTFKSP